MAVTKTQALAYWHRARSEEFGVALRVDDRRGIQKILYDARTEAADPALQEIMMVMPKGDEIWLIKKTVELES